MTHTHNRRFLKAGSLAALFAMLLLFVAPLVSQARATPDVAALALGSICSQSDFGAEPSQPADHHSPQSMQACGYCNLGTHTPVLPSVAQGLFVAVSRGDWTVAPEAVGAPRPARLSWAESRAPPSFV